MKIKIFKKYVVILFLFSATFAQDCSNVFKVYRGYEGLYAEVLKSNTYLENVLRLEVTMSVAAALQGTANGKIILTNTDVYNDLQQNRDLRYKIILPIQNPVPVATLILFNRQPICSGPPAQGSFISTINLFHTYTLNYVNKSPPRYAVPKPPPTYKTPPRTFAPVQTTSAPFYNPPVNRVTQKKINPIVTSTVSRIENNNFLECGIRNKIFQFTSLIVGGRNVKRGEFPWLVAFYYDTLGFICGGSLVSKNAVVTSAHCIRDKNSNVQRSPEKSKFHIGRHNLVAGNEEGYTTSYGKEFFVNPEWKPFSKNYKGDVAVATLVSTVVFSEYIKPICIWQQTQSHSDIVGKSGLVAGWGITDTKKISNVPMWLSLPIVDDGVCIRSNPDVFAFITSEANFCAGDRSGSSPCQGDSGGGFVMQLKDKFYLRGVVSAGVQGYSFCTVDEYVVFTDIAFYSNWIKSHIS